jgi:hypothetical protein
VNGIAAELNPGGLLTTERELRILTPEVAPKLR